MRDNSLRSWYTFFNVAFFYLQRRQVVIYHYSHFPLPLNFFTLVFSHVCQILNPAHFLFWGICLMQNKSEFARIVMYLLSGFRILNQELNCPRGWQLYVTESTFFQKKQKKPKSSCQIHKFPLALQNLNFCPNCFSLGAPESICLLGERGESELRRKTKHRIAGKWSGVASLLKINI